MYAGFKKILVLVVINKVKIGLRQELEFITTENKNIAKV